MSDRHRVNVVITGKLRAAICADCAWIVRGVPAEEADRFAREHERDPRVPVDAVRWADAPTRHP